MAAQPEHSRSASPTRKQFALTGPSRPIDPRTLAVRGDLADVRLASEVFAPHYAAPLALTLVTDAVLRGTSEADGEELAHLAAGAEFELLDRSGGFGWGVAPAEGLVGYVDEAALGASVRPV